MGFYHFIVVLAVTGYASAGEWTYYDGPSDKYAPADWNANLGTCGGSRQSPIDIVTSTAEFSSELDDFEMTGSYMTAPSGEYDLLNNGHAVQVQGFSNTEVSGGGLDGDYVLEQFHMHWGSGMGNGSEHTKDGKHYEAEIHFVNWNKKYNSFGDSLDKGDGLAVLGVFVSESGSDNPTIQALLDHFEDIKYGGNATKVAAFKLIDLFPEDKEKFYRYEGSLTTPDCNEIVIWTVFDEGITMSTAQLDTLRMMKTNDPAIPNVDNWRPTQAVGSRKVHASFGGDDDNKDPSSALHPVASILSVVVASMYAAFFY